MGGEGSIAGMIISIRNNKLLRKKKSIFETGKSFGASTTMHSAVSREIEIKHLTDKEIEYFRLKTKRSNRNYFLKNLGIGILVLFLIGTASYFIFLGFQKARENGKQAVNEIWIQNRTKEYEAYISKAEELNERQYWAEAIWELNKAVIIFPEKMEANLMLADTYAKACINDNIYCSRGIDFISMLIEKYPKKVKFYEIRATIYISVGEVEKAMDDYELMYK